MAQRRTRAGTAETDAIRELRARLADKDALIRRALSARLRIALRRRLEHRDRAQLGEALQQVRLLDRSAAAGPSLLACYAGRR